MTTKAMDPEFLIGASLSADRFKVVARLGSGSMAHVYRAFDRSLETDVVVKVPRRQKLADPGLRDRFLMESRLLVQLQHPHIVRILDVGLHFGLPYFIMQYLSGGSLADKLQGSTPKQAALPVASLRTWLPEIAKALDFAHGRQVIHRDVKPANILFDEAGHAYLSDFGLTRILYGDPESGDSDATADGCMIGTPNYVAPEIVLGHDYDRRADQYSLALTVYHTMIGVPPMQGKTPTAAMVNQTRRILPLLSDLRKEVPANTAAAVARALAKNPEERFASCVEFVNAVTAGLENSPASAVAVPQAATAVEKRSGESTATVSGSGTQSPDSRRRRKEPDSDLRRQERSASVTAADRGRVSSGKSSGSSGASGASGSRSTRLSGVPNIVERSCPKCGNTIRLVPEFGGRRGRCQRCAVRLKIAANLSSLRVISSADDSGAGSDSQEDLQLGERLFGMRLTSRQALALAIAMVLTVSVTAVLLWNQFQKPDQLKQKMNDFSSRE